MTNDQNQLPRHLNELADVLNEAAAKLDELARSAVAHGIVPRMAPGSPVSRLVEQCEQFTKCIAEHSKPTTWEPEGWTSTSN
ncbi:hypothetical protein SAMN05216330_102104 [Bradyrhizobium sp. Ghvi]|nr:hypothetical protein SAMN05216330_102104 [Bradyrhizobium sp. Ghvi]